MILDFALDRAPLTLFALTLLAVAAFALVRVLRRRRPPR
jgi:hypothetical protein